MKIDDIFNVDLLKERSKIEWEVFCQELAQSNSKLEDDEHQCLHVADLVDGHAGQYVFAKAYTIMEDKELDVDDIHGPFYWQDEWFDKWNLEIKKSFGEEYFLDWFHDGSISVLYRPIWSEVEVLEDFVGPWALSKGLPAEAILGMEELEEYLEDIKRAIISECMIPSSILDDKVGDDKEEHNG